MRLRLFMLAAGLLIAAAAAQADTAPIAFGADVGLAKFCKAVERTLLDGDFDRLDATGRTAHDLTHRLPGGTTELELFYRGLAQSDCFDYDHCQKDDVFDRRRQQLEAWRDRAPADETPRVALLRFWHIAAWAARGCGFANTVTPAGWRLFGERLKIDAGYARDLRPEDDPEATRILLELARDFGAPGAQIEGIYKVGRTRFPTYFPLYDTFANMIEAKWSGRSDLATPYMRSLLIDPGGETGDVAYSVAASTLIWATEGDQVFNPVTGIDWPTAQRAFATRARVYGLTPRDWMMLCYLATAAGDRDAARAAFKAIQGPVDYWPKHGYGYFYIEILPWIMARDTGPSGGPLRRH